MSEVFIKFYLDEDVDVSIAEIICSKGFKAIATSEIGRKGESDQSQLEYAVERNLTIVTHNRIDFEELAKEYFFAGRNHPGIIISVQRPPQIIAEKLLHILDDFTADEMKNQIIYI